MLFDILTIFPDFFSSPLGEGVISRALDAGIIQVNPVDLRDYTTDRHRTTDDRPYGGGEGMVMKPEPVYRALTALKSQKPRPKIIMLSPRGTVLNQVLVRELAELPRLTLICGRYEGFDERIREGFVDLEVSIGDYILAGGEAAALVVIEAVARLVPGVLGCGASAQKDSFSDGLLEYPQYTRPREFMGMDVPEVLLSGDHRKIARWRREQSLKITWQRRPDLLENACLDQEDLDYLKALGYSGK